MFIQHRYRVEERFFPSDFQVRCRNFLAMNLPLTSKKIDKNAVYLSAYNERFLNHASTVFYRNRLYCAVGYVFNKNLRSELGYMAQTLEKTNRNQFQIVVFNNLPFNIN